MVAAHDSPNTVDTIEDIIRILREKPEVREAVRREILTDELLELPEKVAQIITIQQQILERLDGHGGRLDSLETIQQKILETLNQHGKTLAEHSKALAEHSKALAEHSASLKNIEENQRGFAAMQTAERSYPLIAMNMGLTEPRLLSIVEIAEMAMGDAASEYTLDELNSFRECDIVIAARNADGDERYIAVQVSSTVDHGDIDRAIGHAKMIERFTGVPAYPAVAGFGNVRVAERRLSSGSVHWHRLSSRGLSPR